LGGSIPETYARFQQAMYPRRDVRRVRIDTAAFTGYEPFDARLRHAPLWTGGRKPAALHWALLWLAAGRALWSVEAGPSVLAGSRTVIIGEGTNHRTLAALAWGDAEIEVAADIVDDVLDGELLSACAVLEHAIPAGRRNASLLEWPVTWHDRDRLLKLAARVSERAASQLPDPPSTDGTRTWMLSSLERYLRAPRRRR
jgi:hypothetical protein